MPRVRSTGRRADAARPGRRRDGKAPAAGARRRLGARRASRSHPIGRDGQAALRCRPDRADRSGRRRPRQWTSASMMGGQCRWVIVGSRPTVSVAISRASVRVEAGENPSRRTDLRLSAHDDHPAQVLEGVGPPVPHVERVDAVVGVAGPVQVPVPLVGREALLVGLLDLHRVGGVRQHLLEEVDVGGMVDRDGMPTGWGGTGWPPRLRAPPAGPGTC